MPFRNRITALIALSAIAAGALYGISIEEVVYRNYSTAELTTLGEYISGNEYYGGRTYARTDMAKKDGLYFIVDFDERISTFPSDSIVVLEFYRASDGELVTLNFPVAQMKGAMKKALYIGLTDEASKGIKVLAWHMTLTDAAGAVLAEKHSFLWEMPDE